MMIKRVDPIRPDALTVREAARIIRAGGVVVFPTRGVYGLAADAFSPSAIGRVFDLKERPAHKALLVLVDSEQGLDRLVSGIPPAARQIMTHCWPGKVTIVFKAQANLPPGLTAGTGRIGVRLPGHPVAAALVRASGGPITGTSANISGKAAPACVEDLDPAIVEIADMVLDAGKLLGGVGSTIIDVTRDPPKILREGAVSARELSALIRSGKG